VNLSKKEVIKKDVKEGVDDPLTIQQEIDRNDIKAFKIEPGHANINDITNEDKSDQDNVNAKGIIYVLIIWIKK
jgi:hypothetical protein